MAQSSRGLAGGHGHCSPGCHPSHRRRAQALGHHTLPEQPGPDPPAQSRTFPAARGSLLSPTASACSWADLPICSYASIILEFKRSFSLPGVYLPGVFIESNQACSARVNKLRSCGLLSREHSLLTSPRSFPLRLSQLHGAFLAAETWTVCLVQPWALEAVPPGSGVSLGCPVPHQEPVTFSCVPFCTTGACSSCKQPGQQVHPSLAGATSSCCYTHQRFRNITHLGQIPELHHGVTQTCPSPWQVKSARGVEIFEAESLLFEGKAGWLRYRTPAGKCLWGLLSAAWHPEPFASLCESQDGTLLALRPVCRYFPQASSL